VPNRRISRGLSRRRLLQLGALGAGSALLAERALGRPFATALAGLCPNPESSYLPLLAIDPGPLGDPFSPFLSPAIRLTGTPDGSTPGQPAGAPVSLYPVVTVQNQGTAPVFNAMVNFYSFSFPSLVDLSPFAPVAVTRADATFLATQLVAISPRTSQVVISPTILFFPGVPFSTEVIVECFDPLTDPIRNPGPSFNLGSDRHAAARIFTV
jgi:hypothetical protein